VTKTTDAKDLFVGTWNVLSLCRAGAIRTPYQNSWISIKQGSRWAGHVMRMEESDPARKVLCTKP
jgi:hypothetical protein